MGRVSETACSSNKVRYLPYGKIRANREAIMRFGKGLHPIEALARDLS